jgi:D-3-phosphoglycerate dehydrogenase
MSKSKKKLKILICDPLDEAGNAVFRDAGNFILETAYKASTAELKRAIKNASGAVVRSGTRLTKDIIKEAQQLRIIGRAGVGIDNVDVDAASKRGIVVANTPAGNTISAAEHTLSLMLAMARNIAPAHESMRQGLWDRKKFTGIELFEKTLGLIGLGRIGTEVAKRALSFGMRVVAYDPFLSPDKAKDLGILPVTLNDVYKLSDFISLHVPLTPQTRNIINADAIQKMKKGARVINCARGGLIDEAALLTALNNGHVAGLALDVYETEPPPKSKLLEHPQVLKTPHLGASTEEAQVKVSVDIARTMVDYLNGNGVRNAVNMASVEPELMKEMEPAVKLAEKIGLMQAQLANGQFVSVKIRYFGKLAEYPLAPMTSALIKGLLRPICAEDVNDVNAVFLAKERGIKLSETKARESLSYPNLIVMTLKTTQETRTVSATLYRRDDARVVAIDDLRIEAIARGHLLAIENKDVPGMVGYIGSLLGKHRINIADMSVGRDKAKKRARIFINVDVPVSDKILKLILKNKNILDAKSIQL